MKNIYTVTFSPTGTSKMVAGLISSAFDGEKIDIDLCMEKNRKLTADGDDLCVFSLPCYGCRVPHTAAERLAGICGQSTPAIICVTFGNRDFEDSLLELSDIVSENGFRVISACAASTEHNIIRVFGAGRPDETDIKEIKQFAADSLDKIISGCRKSPYIPGNRPYKQWKAGDTPIITDKDRCTGCGICSSMCPVQAISPDGKKTDTEVCIGCMRCIRICPDGSRSLPEQYIAKLTEHLEPLCRSRKPNHFYLSETPVTP